MKAGGRPAPNGIRISLFLKPKTPKTGASR